jgi:hypothetical protein
MRRDACGDEFVIFLQPVQCEIRSFVIVGEPSENA